MSDLMEGGLGAAREKFKDLFLFELEWIENAELEDEWKRRGGKRDDLPFFSECALYSLLGKDNARTVLVKLRALGEALGFSQIEMHGDFKAVDGDRRGPKDYPDQDDLDGLEVILRDDAAWLFHSDAEEKLVPIMRAFGLMREMVGAHPFGDGVEYVRCRPWELKIGDRIAQHGRWVDVLGFFDEDGNPSETPVPDKVKDGDPEVRDRKTGEYIKRAYWGAHVKTREGNTHGWPVRSQDEYIVQRQVHPEAVDKQQEGA